jgi:hypothetical protein
MEHEAQAVRALSAKLNKRRRQGGATGSATIP